MTPDDASRDLTHREVEELGLVDRYYRGDLEAELEERFEDHFFACAECREALSAAGDFRDALRDLAAEEASRRIATTVAAGGLARLRRHAPWLVALLALLPAVWLAGRATDLRSEAETARSRAALARAELAATREAARERVAELSARMEESAAAALTQPLSNLPLILLERTRGDDDAIVVPADEAFTLAVDVIDEPFRAFDLEVRDGAGKPVLDRAALRPDVLGTLRLVFPAGFLPPGHYRVTVRAAGDGKTVAVHTLRVPADSDGG